MGGGNQNLFWVRIRVNKGLRDLFICLLGTSTGVRSKPRASLRWVRVRGPPRKST